MQEVIPNDSFRNSRLCGRCCCNCLNNETLEFKLKIEIDSNYVYSVTIGHMNFTQAKEAKEAFKIIADLRKAGCNNVMYCLGFRMACTSPKDKKAVQKVGVRRVKAAYDYFAKSFGV